MITTCKVQYHYQTLLKDLPQAILNREDMDSILNLALKATARALQVDLGLILMLKYQDSLWQNRSNYSSVKAQAQVVAQWSAHSNTSKSLLEHSFSLTNSPLTRSALKNTPQPLAFAQESRRTPPTEQYALNRYPSCFSLHAPYGKYRLQLHSSPGVGFFGLAAI
ncbi:MAG: hypothetical protein GDA44_10935 [Prochloron sp. SP5CPC1]|nr:hypothetical protein [Candidatus Paraprochloron terpiosi SP5CPC1]